MSIEKKFVVAALALATVWFASAASAQSVRVEGAWARATVPGQQSSGVFMTLTAAAATQLVGASTPAAGASEIHEMAMQGDVMRMRPIESLALPAGQPVQLKSGGHHLMLLELKAPLVAGIQVPLELRFRDARGTEERQQVQVPVRALNSGGAAQGHGAGMKH